MVRNPSEQQPARRPPKLEATKRKIHGWNRFVDSLVGRLKPIPALVWATLYRHATDGLVTRSNALLARDVGVSDKTIRRAIGTLRSHQLLQVVRQGGMHIGPSTYRLFVKDLEPIARGRAPRTRAPMAAAQEFAESSDHTPPAIRSAGHERVPMAVKAMTDITDNRGGPGT